jgi:hypothetical protein
MLGRRTVRLGWRGWTYRRLTDSGTVRSALPLDRRRTRWDSRRRHPWRDSRRPASGPIPRPTVRHRLGSATGRRYRTRLSGGSTDGGIGAGGHPTAGGATDRCAVGVGCLTGVGRERVTKLPGDRCLHRRGGRLHILAEIGEFLEYIFTGDTELFRELVHAGLACHCSPHWWSRRQSRSTPLLVHVHRCQSFTTAGTFRNRPALCVDHAPGRSRAGYVPGVPRTYYRLRTAHMIKACTAAVSSSPGERSARGKARRRSARRRHPSSGCTHAPRPGCRRRGSGTTIPSTATTRSNPEAAALVRHPTQVRTGSAGRSWRPRRISSGQAWTVPRRRAIMILARRRRGRRTGIGHRYLSTRGTTLRGRNRPRIASDIDLPSG